MKLHRTTATSRWYFFHKGRRVTTPHTDKQAAESWRRQHLGKLAAGQVVGPENVTMRQLLDLVEQDYVDNGKRSIDSLQSRLKRLRSSFGRIRAADLSEQHIADYRRGRSATTATVNRELEVLRRALALGKRKKLVASPTHVPMMPEDNVRTQRITHEQYRRLIKTLPGPTAWAAALAYHTGWRLGRILSLRWEQVDFDNSVIHPPAKQSKQKRVGIAPIYGDMFSALYACRNEWPLSDRVLRISDINRKEWRKVCAAIGVPDLRFHDLRACAASNMIDAGTPQGEVMRILGHQTDKMFQRYRIDSPKRVRGIGAQMDRFLGGGERRVM